jgi:hypothetical protein
MAEPIFMRVGERNTVDLPEFVRATGNFLGLLQEVDSSVAQRKTGNLRWRVTTLQNTPSPIIGVTPVVVRRRAVIDTSERVEREVISNVASITERGERNRFLSDAALTRVERIARTSPKLGMSAIYTSVNESINLTTAITVKTLSQVQDLTNPKSISFGTVVGSLDTISVHKGLEFRVWDEDTKRPVRCYLHSKQKAQAMELLGARVLVTGMLKADRYGRPLSMSVETFESVSDPKSLPSIEEMRGLIPNLTGGLSLKEFFEDCD